MPASMRRTTGAARTRRSKSAHTRDSSRTVHRTTSPSVPSSASPSGDGVACSRCGVVSAGATHVNCAKAKENRPDSGTMSRMRSPGWNRPVRQASSSITKMLAAPVFPRVCRLVYQRRSSIIRSAPRNRSKISPRKCSAL